MIKDYESYFFSLKNRSLFSSAEFNKNIHSLKVLNKQSFIFSKLIVKNVGVIKKRIDIVVEKIKMTSVNMIKVEGGSFIMGEVVDNLGGELEQPAHRVTLSSYSIGETPVTQSMWITVMGSNPSHFKGDDLPVDNVSWNDCQKFIAKLNDMTGSNYRLPTEAEWEFAARGGIVSRGYKYSGSDNVDEVAWYVEDSNQTTHKIKTKKPNELGIYDMCGNVCEWCCDWFGNYSEHNQENPIGPNVGISRVLRGGCWNCDSKGCSVWKRYYYNPDGCSAYAGFRLVLS
ncbi:MAG: formylglycine-generating enzyme family protein [Bacteroidales bacterium]|nr:formylglycine-generating enzyme family protein [Bacteroidales bacterium]